MVGTTSKTMRVPSQKVGKVIGSRGATLRDIQSDYDVTMTVARSKPEDTETEITISGTPKGIAAAIARVEDIADISNGIEHFREKELELRAKVNDLYQQAQAASGTTRSSLFEQAHHAETELTIAAAEASRNIFAAKNAGYGLDQLDLHGQYLKEALEIVQERLVAVDDELSNRELELTIITGAGNHSEGGKSKIKAEVQELLERGGYAFTSETSGSFVVSSRRAGAVGVPHIPATIPASATPAATPVAKPVTSPVPETSRPNRTSEKKKSSLPSWVNMHNMKKMMSCFGFLYKQWQNHKAKKSKKKDDIPEEATQGLDVETVAQV